jgi:hypothetical protein
MSCDGKKVNTFRMSAFTNEMELKSYVIEQQHRLWKGANGNTDVVGAADGGCTDDTDTSVGSEGGHAIDIVVDDDAVDDDGSSATLADSGGPFAVADEDGPETFVSVDTDHVGALVSPSAAAIDIDDGATTATAE